MEHHLICEASICAKDPNPNYKKEILWYASEPVCGAKPYHKFQKKQALINRYHAKGQFKFPDFYWTAEMLENRVRVIKAKGGNPDK